MKKHSWIVYLAGAVLLAALGWVAHTRVHFQWSVFRDQLQHVDWWRITLGVVMILFCYWLRAARWAVLVKPQKKVTSFSLLGSQVIGFPAVALFGLLAELVRLFSSLLRKDEGGFVLVTPAEKLSIAVEDAQSQHHRAWAI